MTFRTEPDLIKHCLPELTGPGDRVFPEVPIINGFIDLVVQHPSGVRTAFEFKLKDPGKCIHQAMRSAQWADRAIAVVLRPKGSVVRENAEVLATHRGVGLTWVWPEGSIDPVVDPVTRRPIESNVVTMTDQLIEAERMGQEAGTRSPRSLTEHEQIMMEAEELVREQGALLPKEIGLQLHRQFGRDTKEIRKIVTERIKSGKGRTLGLVRMHGVDFVAVVDKQGD